MNQAEKKTRDEISREEATRDPIFLFQVHDGLLWRDYTGFINDSASWRTIGVFATREEAEDFGERTSYRYGTCGKDVDWRVWCIALERDSELARILKDYYQEVV